MAMTLTATTGRRHDLIPHGRAVTPEDIARVERFQRAVLRAFMHDFRGDGSTVSLSALKDQIDANTTVLIDGKRIPWKDFVRKEKRKEHPQKQLDLFK
jgi:hypothetical protein